MKTLFKFFLIAFFIVNGITPYCQQTNNWLENSESIPLAKLYLHTDRDYYFQGDSLWFKAYYLDAHTLQLLPGLNNLFTDLIDENGEIIQSQLLPVTNGVCSGNLEIPRSLDAGKYILRSYTNAQKQIGEKLFFHKSIEIYKVESSIALENVNNEQAILNASDLDVTFLPEGGFLLAGMVNTVAVKATDGNGNAIGVNGKLHDGDGIQIATFSTNYQGMGIFQFLPKAEQKYTVEVAGNLGYKKELQDIRKEGIKFTYLESKLDSLNFVVSANGNKFLNKEYYFALLNKGNVLFYKEFRQRNAETKIIVDENEIPGGINKAVLLDANFKPICERLLFSNNYQINDLNISLNKKSFDTRSEVQLKLSDSKLVSDQTFSSLSVSVVDEKVLGHTGPKTNIHSWLLIDSELKGLIASPADYFVDDEEISSSEKLDLLMLTQGWSNYLWDGLETTDDFWNAEEGGITIRGTVKKLWSKKAVANGDVILGLSKGGNIFVSDSETDSLGSFVFNNLIFTDTASVFVQARNDKGRKSTEVLLDTSFFERPSISKFNLKTGSMHQKKPLDLIQKKYFNELAMKEFDPSYGTILLEQVNIKSSRIVEEDDNVSDRIYPKPHISLKVNPEDEVFTDIYQYLLVRVPGVNVLGNKIFIRGAASVNTSSDPIILLNGARVDISLLSGFPMSQVERVEVYKYAKELALFGMHGSNGAISIFMKNGSDQRATSRGVKGAIATTIKGYEPYREFYTPRYSNEGINQERPDNRFTLYWNPNIMTQSGEVSLSFYTSDDLGKYKIFVEGITNDGQICLGQSELVVTKFNGNTP